MTQDSIGAKILKTIVNISAILTIPYIFILCIFWQHEMFHRTLLSSLTFLTLYWLVVFFTSKKDVVFPSIYWFLLGIMGIIVSTGTISIYIRSRKLEMYEPVWTYFMYVDAAALIISMLIYIGRKEQFELGLRITSMFVLVTGLWGYIDYAIRIVTLYHADKLLIKGWRPFSVYQNPIPAGQIFLMFMWIPFSLDYSKQNKKQKSIDALVRVIVYVPFIILTKSRSVWLGLMLSVIVWLIIDRKEVLESWNSLSVKGKRIAAFFLSIIVCLGVPIAAIIMAPRFKNIKNSNPYIVRTTYFRYTLERFADSKVIRMIFGYGPGSSKVMIADSPYYVEPYNICDNAYLSMLYEWGIIAIVAVIVVDVFAFKTIIRAAKDKQRNVAVSCAYAVVASILPIYFYEAQMWFMVAVPMAIFVVGGSSLPRKKKG